MKFPKIELNIFSHYQHLENILQNVGIKQKKLCGFMEYSIGVVHISSLKFAYPIENVSDKNVKTHHVNITFYSFIVVTNFTFSNYEITSVKINIGWVKTGWDV
jgi:hypothetical protein